MILKKHLKTNGKLLVCLFLSIAITQLNVLDGQENETISLTWLGNKEPGLSSGISWGIPFEQGKIQNNYSFSLTNSMGEDLELQYWPMAYWPDGSIKWLGTSTVISPDDGADFKFHFTPETTKNTKNKSIRIIENTDSIILTTDDLQCIVPKSGKNIISSISLNNQVIAENGKLICNMQDGQANEYGKQPSIDRYESRVDKVTVEQKGPVRAVVKIEGIHLEPTSKREIFPFSIRLYCYAGQRNIKMVHSFIHDANEEKDFVRGIGIFFDIPMNEEQHNRHIRFSGSEGIWDEPVQPLTGGRPLIMEKTNLYSSQLLGKRIKNKNEFPEKVQYLLNNWAAWNDFKLFQGNAEGFTIQKRTNNKSSWIDAGSGTRSSGLVFAGDVSGGLAVCLRDFWQSYPSMLEIRNARNHSAELRIWLWPPESAPMDMRHYDTLDWGHSLDASYEDVQPGFSTPNGVACTSELVLFASDVVPSSESLSTMAEMTNSPILLTTTPEYLHSTGVFGTWSLPDRSTKGKSWIEDQLDNAFNFYKLEIEQRNWYGFWDYGDIMHSYDYTRHVWKYDIGGYAWDNTELMPNMWLWYSYLRSGREDIFRMAEAMTRHTSEVDVYHAGKFAGLGSRHNVRHWGCGAKEVRISQSALHRFYYYLTTDERIGDLMNEVTEASNSAIGKLDPLRLIREKSEHPTHARFGPDWLALVGNWMTAWERTGNTIYKQRILTGIRNFGEMPYGLYSGEGAAFGYNPEDYSLYQLNKKDIGYRHLSILMGGPEIAFELTPLLQNPEWEKLWLQFSKLYGADEATIYKEFKRKVELGDKHSWSSRMPAYYASVTGDSTYAQEAWRRLLRTNPRRKGNLPMFEMNIYDRKDSLEPVYEIRNISTNFTAQWCLNAIQILELVGNDIPEEHERFNE